MTAVSAWLRDATEEQLCLEDHPIEVIPNFVDPERFERVRGSAGARRWARPGEKILVHVSNFRPVKRVMDVRRGLPARAPRDAGAPAAGRRRPRPAAAESAAAPRATATS